MRRLALAAFAALFTATPAAAAPVEASLSKLAMAPKTFDKQEVTVEASMGMAVAQKMLTYCKGKDRAFMVMPRIEGGTMGAMSTVMYQVCMPVERALELADAKASTPIEITGTVKVIKKVGVLIAIVFNDATVTVVGDAPNAVNVNVVSVPAAPPAPPAPPAPAAPPAGD